MHVFLRTASLLLATTIAFGCNDNDADNQPDSGVTPPPPPAATGFVAANLLSDQQGLAPNVDASLVNAWGIAMDTQSFWIANNGTGKVLVVNGDGTPSKFAPPAAALNVGPGITGIVANGTTAFVCGSGNGNEPAKFLVASETGQIFALVPDVAATPQMVIDRSNVGAIYKGLAIVAAADGSIRLLAADFHNGRIDVFDRNFNLIANVVIAGPGLRAGLAPFNLYWVGSTLYVSYAMQDADKKDDVKGAGLGRIDAFKSDGTFIRTVADGGLLNAPWGMQIVPASSTFNTNLTGSLIVGNFGDGTVLAINPVTGVPGRLLMPSGQPVVVDGLWGLMFGNGTVGAADSLYFTAGPNDEAHGLYGRILMGQSPPL